MADIRINQLPNETTPSGTDFVPIDGATTRKTTVTLLTEAGRPAASQAEAEAGTNPTKAMTPLTTAQAIAFQVGAGYQPLDADLTAIAAMATTGIATRTAANTWVSRSVAGTASEITVTNGSGVAGNPTISLAGTASSLSGLSLQIGDILYATGPGVLARLGAGSVNQVLQISGGIPSWANIPGTGDVVGPASSVNGTLALYSGTTGKLLQAGAPTLADFLSASRGNLPTIANNVADATNDIDFVAGAAFSTDATNWPMVGASLTKQLDAAWAVGNNAGGRMSAAAIANTTYHCYQIRRPDTGVVDYGFDVSATAPTLPTNYTQYRRIGSIIREGGVIVPFRQTGNVFKRATSVNISTATAPFASTLLSCLVPTGIPVQPIMTFGLSIGASSSVFWSIGDAASSGATDTVAAAATAAGTAGNMNAVVTSGYFTNTSGQLYHSLAIAAGTVSSTAVKSAGWIDTRGQP